MNLKQLLACCACVAWVVVAWAEAGAIRNWDDEPRKIIERRYLLPTHQAEALTLLIDLDSPRNTTVVTEPDDFDRRTHTSTAMKVTAPSEVHDAIASFVDFLNAERNR